MLRRIGRTACAAVLSATAVVTLFGAGIAVADSSSPRSDKSTAGRSSSTGTSTQGKSGRGATAGSSSSDHHARSADSNDGSEDADHHHEALSTPTPPADESKPESSQPGPGVTSTSTSAVSTSSTSTGSSGTPTVASLGTPIGGPTVGGGPATTGAAGTEAVSASTAPTPPNGAEPSAAGSPAPAVLPVQAASDESTPVASSVPADQGGALGKLPDFLGQAFGTAPGPTATGLSPDSAKSGVLVAVLAFGVLLFLAAHQFVGRRDRGLAGARDAEGVVRFK